MDIAPGSGDELSEQQLKWGYWWVTHKVQIKKVFTIVLGLVGFSLFAYGVWGFADWFIGSGVGERALMSQLPENLTDYEMFHESSRPQQLITQSPQVLTSGEGKYDVIAKVSNANFRWWVEFKFKFTGTGMPDKIYSEYLLPTDSRFVYALGVKAERKPAVSFEIVEVIWHRVDGHVVLPDYASWSSARLNFIIDQPKFTSPDANASLAVSRASFRVTNDTAFSYVAAPFFVTLMSGSTVVGVNRVVATRFLAGETRDIEATWFNELPNVTRVDVRPEINIFDGVVYLKPGE